MGAFQGLTYMMNNPKVSVIIFPSGKINSLRWVLKIILFRSKLFKKPFFLFLTLGGKSEEQILQAFQNIGRIIS